MIPTVQIKSPVSDDNQLGYVVINEADFDEESMELFGADAKSLTVPQLKDALTAKGIAFEATAKKADLQALLDAAQ